MGTETVLIPCAACGALNRLPRERLADVPICADCGERLVQRKPADVDEKIFRKMIERSELPLVVDFWAPWCGPCRSMAPQFEKAAKQLEGRVLFIKLNTEAWPGPAQQYGIQSIPTMIVFASGGSVLGRKSGALDSAQIVQWLDSTLA